MQRRSFITLVGVAVAASPLAARAQQPAMPVIGFLHSASPDRYHGVVREFRLGLSETGYNESQNLAIEYRFAEDRNDRLPALAAELVRRQVALIAANSVSALVLKAATTTIPIVFQSGVDPVKIGLVASLGHPGGNVTGVSFFASTLEAKKLEVLHELVPRSEIIGALANPNNPEVEAQSDQILAASRVLGRRVLILRAGNERDLEAVFTELVKQGVRALLVVGDPYFNSQRTKLISLTARYAIPAIYSNRENVDEGGFISYGSNLEEAYRQVGTYAGRILKGENPADLPVLQPTKFEMIINLKTAKALGIDVPNELLDRADATIE
jgi:putative ABC transport system substrate-binding protein